MKIKILFGAIFSICIIMLINTSSAVEYKTVTDYNVELLESKSEKIKQIIEIIDVESNNIESLNELQKLSDVLSEFNNQSLLRKISNLPNLILSLILSIIGTIIGIIYGKIFGPLTVFLVKILTAPAILLAKIIEFIINLFSS